MSKHLVALSIVALFIMLLLPGGAAADYGSWSPGGLRVNTEATETWMLNSSVLSDGLGGTFVVWSQSDNKIYAQKIDSEGNCLWGTNGKLIAEEGCYDGFRPYYGVSIPKIVGDGAGGAYIVYKSDVSTGEIYADRIDANGNCLWTREGGWHGAEVLPPLNLNYGGPGEFSVCASSDGAVIVSYLVGYNDLMQPPEEWLGVFAQKLDSGGYKQWGDFLGGFVGDVVMNYGHPAPAICSDGQGGAFIAWYNPTVYWEHLYLQRISSEAQIWASVLNVELSPEIQSAYLVSDGALGVICGYEQFAGFYAKRINQGGGFVWPARVTISESVDQCILRTDNAGGGIATWSGSALFANRIDGNGNLSWGAGVELTSSFNSGEGFESISLDDQGAIYSWYVGEELRAMKVSSSGEKRWQSGGIPICTASGLRTRIAMASGGSDGAIIAWLDSRNSVQNVYAQKVVSYFDFAAPSCDFEYKYLNVATGQQVFRFFMDGCPQGDLEMLRIELSFNASTLPRDIEVFEITLDKPDTIATFWNNGDIIADGPARIHEAVGGYVATTVSQRHFSRNLAFDNKSIYGFTASVLFNGTEIAEEIVTVKSPDYTGDGTVNSSDLIYFGSTYGKKSGQAGYNAWFDFDGDRDVDGNDQTIFYAHMYHQKPGDYQGFEAGDIISEERMEPEPVPTSTILGDCYPNPFNPMTTIEFSLAEDSRVNLSVYSVNGELVCTLVNGMRSADTYKVPWNGTNNAGRSVSSGIYFYRLKTDGCDQAKKMLLLR